MTTTAKNIIPPKDCETVQTAQYSPSLVRCIIDKATATNNSAGNLSISVNLVPPSGGVGTANRIVNARVLAPGECYTFPELVGQIIESGGVFSTLASGSGITIAASGREVG